MSNLPATATPPGRCPEATLDLEHEWRTPMTVIQSAAEVLRAHDDLTNEERERFLDALIEGAARLRASLETVFSGSLSRAAAP